MIFEKRLKQFNDNIRERERERTEKTSERDRLRFLYIVENIKY